MYDSHDGQDGIYYPRDLEEMAQELERREFRGGSKEDREELAAEIFRRRHREHVQASRSEPRSTTAPRPMLPC